MKNAYGNPSRVFDANWVLPNVDSGGVAFKCCAPQGGLLVYFVDIPSASSLASSRGYAVVFDNQRDPPETYVSAIPGLPTKHPRSKVNRGFRLHAAAPETCMQYWIVYRNGTVIVGQGGLPGEEGSRVITCMQHDDAAPPGIQYFGFGALRHEEVGIQLEDIYTFDAPPDGMQWEADSPQCFPCDTTGLLE